MKSIDFVNYNLDRSLLIILEDEIIHEDDWAEVLANVLYEGYKVSIRHEADRGSHAIYVTGTDRTPNEGKCLSIWSSSLEKCFQRLDLMHNKLCNKGKWDNIDAISDKILREALGK